jgi:predicted dehydrogenase
MAHVAGYLASDQARLVAVADAWEPRRQRIGGTFEQGSMLNLRPVLDETLLEKPWEELGARVYEDVRALAVDRDVELVSLCTPDDTHETFATLLLESGKHMLLEKPVALTLDSAERIREAAARAGRRVAVGYEMRINPAVQKIRELVTGGVVGEVRAFSLQQYRKPFRRDKWQKWIQERKRSGGLVVEETCHWFDLARFITGKEVARVHCVATDEILPDFDYEDIAFVQGWFDDGAILQVGHSLTGFDFSIIIQVHGTKGSIWCGLKAEPRSLLDAQQSDYIGVVSWGPVEGGVGSGDPAVRSGGPQNGGESPAVAPASGAGEYVTFGTEVLEGESIRDQVVHTVAALAGGRPFLAELADGIEALRIALAARRSIESGAVEDV